jgi:ABC-type sugar transport system ATPase subunit
VDRIEALGHETLLFVRLVAANGEAFDPIQVRVADQLDRQPGDIVQLAISWDQVHFFDTQTHEAIFSKT